MTEANIEIIRRFVWGLTRLALASVAGWLIREGYASESDMETLYAGVAGVGVLGVVVLFRAVRNVRLIQKAIDLAPGSRLNDVLNRKPNDTGTSWTVPILIPFLLVGVLTATSCDKSNLLKTTTTGVIMLQRGLEAADVAYASKFLGDQDFRSILMQGESARKVLVELNTFGFSIASELPTDAEKQTALVRLNEAMAHLDNLVAKEVIFKNEAAKREYARYMRPAQAAVRRLIQLVTRLKTQPSVPPAPKPA